MSEPACTLENKRGMSVTVSSYGAAITALRVPDREGRIADVVLGFDTLEDYRRHDWYCGAVIGRYAGRIRDARFSLDGRHCELSANHGAHHLHGGHVGFDKVFWELRSLPAERAVRLRHISPDGDEGYPGTLDAAVAYMLTDNNELIVDFAATIDRPAPVNLTQHTYFNLAGCGDVLAHQLAINADAFAEVDGMLLPTGRLLPVESTPLDFRSLTAIGARIADPVPQMRFASGYDHDFRLRASGTEYMGARFAARVVDPLSGRVLEVFTSEPALHFYSGQFIESTPPGKHGRAYGPHSGLALEAQHFSDSPNQPAFPTTILRHGEQYRARTIFRFSIAQAA